jgi:hypothetical protein
MKSKLSYMILMILLIAPAVMAGASVDALHLKSLNGETVLKIDIADQFQYSHQIEEAKDGKPYRIIVDIFPSVHNLGQKIYSELPPSIISAIRTSQYSVKPDKIVRVVLDLKNTAIYRIEKSGNFVFVYIPDNTVTDFPVWSSKEEKMPEFATVKEALPVTSPPIVESPLVESPEKAVTSEPMQTEIAFEEKASITEEEKAEEKPQSEIAPVQIQEEAIPEPESPSTVISSPLDDQIPVIETPVVATPPPYYTPKRSRLLEQEMADDAKAQAVLARQVAQPPVSVVTVESEASPAPIVAQTVVQDASIAEASVATVSKADTPPAIAPSQMPPRPPDDSQLGVVQEKEEPPVASVQPPQKAESAGVNPDDIYLDSSVIDAYVSPDDMPALELPQDSISAGSLGARPTSRFRREPAFPNKLKGTIVAEFPQRLVIEYAPGNFRDPFETLINETKQSEGPREDRIPDVETSRLVGILENENGNNRALLEDLDGYGYILKSGDKVKKGFVEKIDADKAFFQLFEYGWSRTIALYLGHQ